MSTRPGSFDPALVVCLACDGTGAERGHVCGQCRGTGEVTRERRARQEAPHAGRIAVPEFTDHELEQATLELERSGELIPVSAVVEPAADSYVDALAQRLRDLSPRLSAEQTTRLDKAMRSAWAPPCQVRSEAGIVGLARRLAAAAQVSFPGPHDTDADMMRTAAWKLENGYEAGGSNVRAAVARVLRVVADALPANAAAAERSQG